MATTQNPNKIDKGVFCPGVGQKRLMGIGNPCRNSAEASLIGALSARQTTRLF